MQKRSILVVEDEPLIAADIEELCQSQGHEVCEVAHNAGQALVAIREKHPTLVLLDINISDDVDGIEIAELLLRIQDSLLIHRIVHGSADPH